MASETRPLHGLAEARSSGAYVIDASVYALGSRGVRDQKKRQAAADSKKGAKITPIPCYLRGFQGINSRRCPRENWRSKFKNADHAHRNEHKKGIQEYT